MLGLVLISSTSLPYSYIHAEKEAQSKTIFLRKMGTGMKPLRPKSPDRQVITCAYDGEILHLSFVIPEGTATFSVTDETLLTSTYEIDTTPLEVSVSVGELFGTVSLEMETALGNGYNGIIE